MSDPHAADPAELGELYRLTSEFIDRSAGRLRRLKVNAGDASLEVEWLDPATPGLPGSVPATENTVGSALAEPSSGAADEVTEHYIRAPLVGTFYRASSPDSSPFVNSGDRIRPGQVLCIIEAMKLMNEVECDRAGKIAAILVENAHPVEYGEPLFIIETENEN